MKISSLKILYCISDNQLTRKQKYRNNDKKRGKMGKKTVVYKGKVFKEIELNK